ncbi:mitochondrial 2-oxoglutarate/malate carrier protein-like [Dendronephthya gigantea]|uniref:mitochondrial 2-oxoglutarate/malate carrier protein-like n=1 Tax=Dendronephthya gigantea TaxID=151771 RepID=UPI00106AC150|nr:mitochondrial 2-oxoglutarate/malate carrier protein-like [Dendronephthya gigantea]
MASNKISAQTSPSDNVRKNAIPNYARFVMGGLSGMAATCFVQPLDLVKTRMQMSGAEGAMREHKTSFHAVVNIVRKEGFLGVYNGLSAALMRQATYTTTRLGVYTSLYERFKGPEGQQPHFLMKCALGVTAGAIGAFVGTPADLSLIRMTADGRLPLAERRNYTSVFNALKRIATEEGFTALWTGCIPTMTRAMVVNAAQLATYSQSKQFILGTGYFEDNIACHFTASMISGLATTYASMPVDIAKTRIQNMKIIDGVPEYKNGFDVISRVARKEGFLSLWKGFTPCYMRIGPHTVLTFIFLEQMQLVAKKAYGVK